MTQKTIKANKTDAHTGLFTDPNNIPSKEKSSFNRLMVNSKQITNLLSSRKELKKIRLDELDLLRDIRQIIETEAAYFDNIKEPAQYRREIRAKILPNYITSEFIRTTRDKLLSELLLSTADTKDQDALMTALVFLQSHTDLGVACEDNPLWEIIFNLSLRDGIRFVDSLTALIEGLDSIKSEDPDKLTQHPPLLQKTEQICQWQIFWRQLAEKGKDYELYEPLVSALLRGEMIVEIYFDEILHLPLFLYRQFKDLPSDKLFIDDQLTELEKMEISHSLFENIRECAKLDLPKLIPVIKKRLNDVRKKFIAEKNNEKADQINVLTKLIDQTDDVSSNVFLLTLLIAKISIKKYWDNKRDFFFFFTVWKNPENSQNYYDYAQILLKLKYNESIEKISQCAIEVDDDNFWGYWGLGRYYLKQNKLAESDRLLADALKIAQKYAIHSQDRLKRELFLIKEDIKSLNQKKIKQQTQNQPQINLF